MPIASRKVLRSSTNNSERVLGPLSWPSKSSTVTSVWVKSSDMLIWALTLDSPTMGANSWIKRVRYRSSICCFCISWAEVKPKGCSTSISFIKLPKLSTTDTFSGAK